MPEPLLWRGAAVDSDDGALLQDPQLQPHGACHLFTLSMPAYACSNAAPSRLSASQRDDCICHANSNTVDCLEAACNTS